MAVGIDNLISHPKHIHDADVSQHIIAIGDSLALPSGWSS
jgi:hypothetical protein